MFPERCSSEGTESSGETLEGAKKIIEIFAEAALDQIKEDVKFTDEGTLIPKDFCYASLLNAYPFNDIHGRGMSIEEHDCLMDFAEWIEEQFKVCSSSE